MCRCIIVPLSSVVIRAFLLIFFKNCFKRVDIYVSGIFNYQTYILVSNRFTFCFYWSLGIAFQSVIAIRSTERYKSGNSYEHNVMVK